MKLISTLCLSLLFVFQITLAQTTTKVYLSGTGYDHTEEWDFYCSDGMKSKTWSKIEVPSCWEQQGFGTYNYGHDDFKNRLNETGTYRHNFFAPKAWKGKEVQICFEGVMTDAEVKINGKKVGTHQGAFYKFDFDISDFLKFDKENQLEVVVHKHSANESINQAERKADYWIFGGIFRPVSLEIKPKTNIQRVAIDARADGTFKSNIYLSEFAKGYSLKVKIQSLDGNSYGEFSTLVENNLVPIEGKSQAIVPWNPEHPSLYNAVYELSNAKGKIIHVHTERFGFRTVEIRESDGIYVNNVKVKLKGVCRHSFHSKYGRTTSKQLSIEHVKLMKEMNMNAVRMSHYPPNKHFLDVCDSLGLLVLDELAGWQRPSYDDEIGLKLLNEMIAYDVNHPSIILWDNANEGGENNTLNTVFAELDIQQRKVLHPWQDFEEFNTLHYIDYNYLATDNHSKRKLFMPTELLHGLYDGGHGAGLEDYWKLMWSDPLCAGGFLWVFADEGIERTDKNNVLDTDGNHAPDGIVGPNLEKEGSFYTIKEIWSPIFIEDRYLTSTFNGVFKIENRYHYTNLNECKFNIEWIKVDEIGKDAKEVIAERNELSLNLASGFNGILKLELPNNWQQFDVLSIEAIDFNGEKINTWSWPVKKAETKALEFNTKVALSEIEVIETESSLKVAVGQMEFTFNKANGTISKVSQNDALVPLSNGPLFVSKEKGIRSFNHMEQNDVYIIKAEFDNDDFFQWTINKNGTLDLSVSYEPKGGHNDFIGVTFDYSEDQVKGVKWLGNGPFRVYKNRMKGVQFGLWNKTFNNTITGYSDFIYPEFKGYHANMYWFELLHKNSPDFKVIIKSNDIFVHLFTPGESNSPANTRMKYPKGDLSFLQGINPIGTKFKHASALGPQSNQHHFDSSRLHGRKLKIDLSFEF